MFTSLVPVQMGNIVEASFAHADPFAAHYVVNIYESVS